MNVKAAPAIRSWHRGKNKYLASSAAIVLAVTGLGAAFGSRSELSSPNASVPRQSFSIHGASLDLAQPYTYYLVASEAQRDELIASVPRDDFPGENGWILVVRSQHDELSIAGTQAEQTVIGRSVEVIDLRSEPVRFAPVPAEQN